MAAIIDPKRKNGFKIVETWDNHSESLKNNLYNDFKGQEYLLDLLHLTAVNSRGHEFGGFRSSDS